jgi:hypothetical protein
MPLPKYPEARDNNNSSSASLNFQTGGYLRSPRGTKNRIESNYTHSPQQRRSFQRRGPTPTALKPPLLGDREGCGRMFPSEKAEVIIIPGQDHLAASVYGDAVKLRCDPDRMQTAVRKEHTSGYDFGEMLKDQDANLSGWGSNAVSSSRWY